MRELFCVTLWLMLGFVWAQPVSAEQVFTRMIEAETSLKFVGEVEETVLFPPRRPATQRAAQFSQPPRLSPELIRRNFDLVLAGNEQIAGREATVLELSPNNGFSPSWYFWVDDETGLRLAYEQRGASGRLLAEGRYLAIERVDVLPERRDLSLPEPSSRVQERIESLVKADYWLEGFIPVQLERTRLGARRERPALRLIAWDGLNFVVLLIYGPRAEPPKGNSYLRSLELEHVTLSALGPLSTETLEGWLKRLANGPLQNLNENAIRRWPDLR